MKSRTIKTSSLGAVFATALPSALVQHGMPPVSTQDPGRTIASPFGFARHSPVSGFALCGFGNGNSLGMAMLFYCGKSNMKPKMGG